MTQVKHCPWCEGVFSADTADGLCPRCLMQVAVVPEPQTNEAVPPQAMESARMVIGPYKLLERIGEGGMAVVYLAEQEKPLRRRVALKIIKLGMDTRQVAGRFEAERQALAMMDHPNIARVFDAGATDLGRPYFVMELVQGLPITEYCDRNRLSTQERLELFIPVCNAVHHAHQKGIIHRDLKPLNILVTVQDGTAVPKVIDFGIAKAMDQSLTEQTIFTRYAEIIGTPEHMSPEQAEMGSPDIDTRTDIYSLGVVLYELLTGTLPFDPEVLRSAAFNEVQRIIREEESLRPSTCMSRLEAAESVRIAQHRRTDSDTLRRKLNGDLDWITLKAMEKDRDRRYGSAEELAADVRRYLNNEPVAAGPPSTLYRAGKYVRRHRALMTGVAAVLIALAVGVAGMTVFALKAREQARIAQTVADFLTRDVLGSVTPERTKSPAVTIHSILDSASGLVQTKFADEPLVEASIRQTLGETYIQLGDYKAAEAQLVRAYNIHRKTLGHNVRLTLTSMSQLGRLYYLAGRHREAEPVLSVAWKETSRLLGNEDPQTLRAATWLGLLHLYLAAHGHTDETESLLTRAFDTSRRVLGEEDPVTLEAMYGVAFLRGILWGRYNEAAALVAGGLRTCQRVLGEDHRLTLQFMVLSAWVDLSLGRFTEAETRASASLEANRHILGAEHPETFFATAILGYTYTMQHEYERAEPLLVEAVRLSRRDLGQEHFSTLLYTAYLAWTYLPQGRFDEAEPLLASVLDGRGVLGDEHPIILDAITGTTSLCAMQGQADRLKAWCAGEVERLGRERGENHPAVAFILNTLAWCQATYPDPRLRDKSEAVSNATRACELSGWQSDRYVATLAAACAEAGDFALAVQWQEKAVDLCTRAGGKSGVSEAWLRYNLRLLKSARCIREGALAGHGRYLLANGEYDKAETQLNRVLDVSRRHLGESHAETCGCILTLIELYEAWDKPAEAQKWRSQLAVQNRALE